MNLSKEQLEFLNTELGLSEKQIATMSKKEWSDVREKCFMIEAAELADLAAEEEATGEEIDDETERCMIATSIASLRYDNLHS